MGCWEVSCCHKTLQGNEHKTAVLTAWHPSQEALASALRGVLRKQLAALGWPPPLSGLGVEQDAQSQEWHGFEQAPPLVRVAREARLRMCMPSSGSCGSKVWSTVRPREGC